ncbi:MAG: KpsF/GutQ family sugar-phosphate isomerase [Candidatus Eisenbacteria bacterium]|nr:KpsF/GutQ family sugar-phosphate isomerase [Candidatus Eisenbacteria bacterium]
MKRSSDAPDLIAVAREVLQIESKAVEALAGRVDEAFARAVRLLVATGGTVVVLGVGKSGIVARKIAATLSSTGTRAVFLHPADGAHGDIGIVSRGDVVVAVSKSGEGGEMLDILPALSELDVPLIAITGNADSSLARRADVVLDAHVEREACPMDVVPTASTTASLAMGDALAVAVLREKRVGREDLAAFHPGGLLGRQLALRVSDVMHTGDELPRVERGVNLREAIVEIANKRLGLTTVVDREGRLCGILTDGDLKRILMSRSDALEARVEDVMTRSPRTIGGDEPVLRALELMESNRPSPITSLVIVDEDGRVRGVIHIHDCLRTPR